MLIKEATYWAFSDEMEKLSGAYMEGVLLKVATDDRALTIFTNLSQSPTFSRYWDEMGEFEKVAFLGKLIGKGVGAIGKALTGTRSGIAKGLGRAAKAVAPAQSAAPKAVKGWSMGPRELLSRPASEVAAGIKAGRPHAVGGGLAQRAGGTTPSIEAAKARTAAQWRAQGVKDVPAEYERSLSSFKGKAPARVAEPVSSFGPVTKVTSGPPKMPTSTAGGGTFVGRVPLTPKPRLRFAGA